MAINQSFSQDTAGDINNATFQDKAGTGTITALNGTVVITPNGCSTIYLGITGTWVATLSLQADAGDGVWNTTIGILPFPSGALASLIGSNTQLIIPCGGFKQVRIIATAYTSGTVTVTSNSGSGTNAAQVFNNNPSALQMTASQTGTWTVNAVPLDGTKATYAASATITTAAAATDVFTLTGSGSKTVRVTNVYLSATGTTATTVIAALIKRSTADTGGTSTAPAKVPYDSTNAAATATVLAYTANPTLGTAVGNVAVLKLAANTATTVGNDIVLDFGDRPAQAIVLRGTSEVLAINFNATTITGGSASLSMEWTEE